MLKQRPDRGTLRDRNIIKDKDEAQERLSSAAKNLESQLAKRDAAETLVDRHILQNEEKTEERHQEARDAINKALAVRGVAVVDDTPTVSPGSSRRGTAASLPIPSDGGGDGEGESTGGAVSPVNPLFASKKLEKMLKKRSGRDELVERHILKDGEDEGLARKQEAVAKLFARTSEGASSVVEGRENEYDRLKAQHIIREDSEGFREAAGRISQFLQRENEEVEVDGVGTTTRREKHLLEKTQPVKDGAGGTMYKNPLFNQKKRLETFLVQRPEKKELEERAILRHTAASSPGFSKENRRKLEGALAGDRAREREHLVDRNIVKDADAAGNRDAARAHLSNFLRHETEVVSDSEGRKVQRRSRRLEKTKPVADSSSGVTACANPLAGSRRLERLITSRPKRAELVDRNIIRSERKEDRARRLDQAREAISEYLESRADDDDDDDNDDGHAEKNLAPPSRVSTPLVLVGAGAIVAVAFAFVASMIIN